MYYVAISDGDGRWALLHDGQGRPTPHNRLQAEHELKAQVRERGSDRVLILTPVSFSVSARLDDPEEGISA